MIQSFISSLHKVCLEQPDDELVDSLWFEPTSIELADAVWLATQIGLATSQEIPSIPDNKTPSEQEEVVTQLSKENIQSSVTAPTLSESEYTATSNTQEGSSLLAVDAKLQQITDKPESQQKESLELDSKIEAKDKRSEQNEQKRVIQNEIKPTITHGSKPHQRFKPTHIIQPDSESEEEYYQLRTKEGSLHSPSINKRKSQQRKGRPFKTPAATMLPDPLSIERALRPLMRSVESRKNTILDEDATVQRVAEEGIWCPVLQGEPERWFEIALVIDQSPFMIIWQQTINELRYLFERHGAFRHVRTWSMVTKKNKQKVRIYSGAGVTLNYGRPCSPQELIDPLGRRLIIVVTDCVSPAWHSGEMIQLLELWGKTNSVSLLQTLPRRLWSGCALRETIRVKLQATTIGLPNSKLGICGSSLWLDDNDKKNSDLKVPVLTIEPKPLIAWSNMMTGKGGARALGVVFSTYAKENNKPLIIPTELNKSKMSAEQRVQIFFATASPTAQRLVVYLAAAPLTLPVMRLVQRVMLPKSRQIHLAEVFLGGLLKQEKSKQKFEEAIKNPNSIKYDFHDGVRTKLLDLVLIPDALKVIKNVSEFLEYRLGQSLDFQALLSDPTVTKGISLDEHSRPFAAIQAEILRRLGGEYVQLANRIEKGLIQAHKIPIEEIREDMILQGIVTGLTDFRAFVDIGGISAVLRMKDMTWGGINHPSEIVNINEEIEVIVLKNNYESGRINVGLKQMTEKPLTDKPLTDKPLTIKASEIFIKNHPVGCVVSGTVSAISNTRITIQLKENVESFLYYVSVFNGKITKTILRQILTVGDVLNCEIIENNERNSHHLFLLSMTIEEIIKNIIDEKVIRIIDFLADYPINSSVTGTVIETTAEKAIIQLPNEFKGTDLTTTTIPQVGEEVELRISGTHENNTDIFLSQVYDNEIQKKSFQDIKEGMILQSIVKNIDVHGAFVNAEGLDGLIRKDDMSWGSVRTVEEIKKIVCQGDQIFAKVLKIDSKKKRLLLGLKYLKDDPWIGLAQRYLKKMHLLGTVISLVDYGCFIEIEEGIEGLVHSSEMDWTNKTINPRKVVQLGEKVEVMVLEIDEKHRRLSLGMKQCKINPWEEFAETYSIGEKVSGKIKTITDYGFFIHLDNGIHGLVHLSDISWSEDKEGSIRDYNKGDEVETIILKVDPELKRISLGIKQLEQDPFQKYMMTIKTGNFISGIVKEINEEGAVITLAENVEGHLTTSETQNTSGKNTRSLLKIGDVIEAKFVGFQKKKRIINLSIKEE